MSHHYFCPECKVRLPFHRDGCTKPQPPREEPTGLDAVSRPPFTIKHDDCDCMSCRPWTS